MSETPKSTMHHKQTRSKSETLQSSNRSRTNGVNHKSRRVIVRNLNKPLASLSSTANKVKRTSKQTTGSHKKSTAMGRQKSGDKSAEDIDIPDLIEQITNHVTVVKL